MPKEIIEYLLSFLIANLDHDACDDLRVTFPDLFARKTMDEIESILESFVDE